MNVFELFAKIGLDSSGFTKALDGVMSASKIGVAAIGAVVTETAALSAALVKGVSDLAAYGDHIDKQSQKMNLSAQAYQEWDAILQHSGASIDSMQASMKTLANAVESENDAFLSLGMSMEDVRKMSNEELFSKTITALQKVDSETQRTYLAGQLLGRGATELGALLNTSAEDTEKMRQRVRELGGVMSDTAVKDAAAFQDSLQDMKTSMSGMLRGIKAEFLPSFTQIMDGLTNVFAGEDGGVEKISKGIDDVFANINSATSKLKPVIAKVGGIVAKVIKENAPKLIKEGTKILGDVIKGVVQNLPSILSTVGDVVGSIGEVVMSYLPGWISDDIKKVVSTVKDTIGNIDFDTLREKFVIFGEKVGEIIEKVSGGFTWLFENIFAPLVEWGANDVLPKVFDALAGAADILKEAIEFLEPVASALWDNFLKPLAGIAGEAISASLDLIAKAIQGIADTFEGVDWSGYWEEMLAFDGSFSENWVTGWNDMKQSFEEFKTEFKSNWKQGWKELKEKIEDAGNSLDDFFETKEHTNKWSRFWQGVGEKVFDAKSKLSEYYTAMKDKASEMISGIVQKWTEVAAAIQSVIDKVIDVKNKISEGIGTAQNYVNIVSTVGSGVFGKLLGRNHATGMLINRPVYDRFGDMYGEAGREAVVPLESNTWWIDTLADKLSRKGGSGVVVQNLNLTIEGGRIADDYDTERLVEKIAEKLGALNIRQERAVGGIGWTY